MKNNLLSFIAVLLFALGTNFVRAQTLALSVTNSTACVTSTTNPVFCTVTTTISGASMYLYSVIQTCGSGTISSGPLGYYFTPTATLNLSCTGPYTVFCNAYTSGTVYISQAIATGVFNNATTPTINISPSNGAGCIGTTFTINLSGANTYTTNGSAGTMIFGTQTGTSIVTTPTTASCFSVAATSTNGCISNTTRRFSLTAPPNVTATGPGGFCSSGSANLYASGAASYTWSNGALGNSPIVSPTVATCYTVIGSNACPGTSSAVVCVSPVVSPTITYSPSSPSICAGSNQTLSVSGASNYIWSVYYAGTTTLAFTSTLSNFVITPTLATTYSVNVQANNGSGCNAGGGFNFTVIPSGVVSVPPSYSICSGAGVTLFASGASNYTWNTGANTSNIFVTPTVATCYTVTANSPGCGITSSAVTCVSLLSSNPSITVTGAATVCYGSSNLYTATGGNGSYNWYRTAPYSFIGSGTSMNLNLLQSSCFYVSPGSTVTGCGINNTTVCPVILPSPTLNINSTSTLVCQGSSAILTATGANTYTWLPGNILSNTLAASPMSATCYTLLGMNSNGCSSSAVNCVSTLLNPTISINGPNSVCPGSNLTFTATGANTYTWSNSATGNIINVSPTSNNCYSVIGTSSNGCSNLATKCITISPIPNITISGQNSVCVGSSNTFTVSGGSTYTWNTGANTYTLNVLPSASSNYTVTASHLLNNCTSTATVALTVFTNCAIVWPGDANRDGQVDNTDVFELGLASGSTGAARTPASNTWSGQFASAWAGTVSTGWNKVHADCNGDGTIGAADTVAISNNYSSTHSFKNTSTSSGLDLILSPQNSEVYAGIWNVIDIILGDASNTQSQIYGAAFDLDYDQNMVENNDVRIVYNTSFLNNNNQNIEFGKTEFNSGKVYAASVRTDHADVNGNGKIAEIWFKIKTGFPDNTSFNFGISNGKKTNANGVMGVLNTSGAMNLNLNNDATGTSEKLALANTVHFYPNPASNNILIKNNVNTITTYKLIDLTGRTILVGEFTLTKTIDISAINKGVYFIEFASSQGKIQKKFIKD